jgi:hypothetical protein
MASKLRDFLVRPNLKMDETQHSRLADLENVQFNPSSVRYWLKTPRQELNPLQEVQLGVHGFPGTNPISTAVNLENPWIAGTEARERVPSRAFLDLLRPDSR